MSTTSKYETYHTAIFTLQLTKKDVAGFESMLERLLDEAKSFDGFLYDEGIIDPKGTSILIFYFKDPESMKAWRDNGNHRLARKKGKNEWLSAFEIHVGKVLKEYSFSANEGESHE